MIDVREHLSESINRTRIALELRRGSRPAIVVALGIVLGLVCAFYVAKNVSKSVYTPTQEVRFAVADANAVQGGDRNEVRFKGIDAGSIKDVELVDGRAVITAEVYEEFAPLYRDARAILRPNSALEDMYLDVLDRGTPAAGKASPDEPLAIGQTDVSVQVEDALSAFSPDVRTRMATMLRNLGGGLEGRGDDLRRAFVEAVPLVQVAERLAGQLARRGRLTRSLVRSTGVLTGELSRRDAMLRRLVREGATTARALERSSGGLDATLAELPGLLGRVDSSFAALRGVLPEVDGAVRALKPAAAELPAGLSAVRSLSDAARPAVRALRTPVRRLVPLAGVLTPTSESLSRAVRALRPQSDAIDHVTKTVAGCGVALQGFFQWTASLVKYDDARGGPGGRGDLNVGLDSTSVLKDPNVIVPKSCAPGRPIGGVPGTGGDLRP
ncbi:MlaD family protein [Conexibacter sp. SYSU D00693]|uniref:MlaD family protein n=1 Tax=Conexibacter sp. SYSU D00693 TaxID=2812560 RepID=UPI00196A417D|nr:MlaD family protein [Conexibacter sp. SYSU D00693]